MQNNPVHTILADIEFQVLKEELEVEGVVQVNVVERQNIVIKETVRAIVQTLPYTKIPKKMRVEQIQYVIFWLNQIPKEGKDFSPRDMILGGQKLDFKSLC